MKPQTATGIERAKGSMFQELGQFSRMQVYSNLSLMFPVNESGTEY